MRTRLLFFIACYSIRLSSISIVYNFRIAQITKQPINEEKKYKSSLLIALLFDQYQKKYIGNITQNFAGALGAYIYNVGANYCRADIAVSHIQEKTNHTVTFSGTEADDILFTIGHNIQLNNKSVITLSGLFGIPTHRVFRLQHVDFGYGQVGTGIQLDGSYNLSHGEDILYGGRYVYFIPKTAYDNNEQKYTLTAGNLGDLLIAYKKNWIQHGIEFGYTARFNFGAAIYPMLTDFTEKTDYIRSNFYIVYKYKFFIQNIQNRLLLNLSYGFDHRPYRFGNKNIITLWGSWNIYF